MSEESSSEASSEALSDEASSSSPAPSPDRPNKKQRTNTSSSPTKKQTSGPASAPPLELPPPISNPNTPKQKIIILLDQASLETVKTRKGNFELLNCDDHRDICKKFKKNPADFRPDITHQEILSLIDSPLNKAGCLQIYLKTTKNVLIQIHSSVRVPRTFRRFSGLVVQLLHKMKIKASNSSQTLMKVIKNPFSQYLPPGTKVYGMSCKGTLYSPYAFVKSVLPPELTSEEPPVCFIFGAMATGHLKKEDHPYIEKMISVSDYPLSGAAAVSRVLGAAEHHWGIV